jgi:hypothetical protein
MENLQYNLYSAGLTHNIRRGRRTSARTLHSRSVFLLVSKHSAKNNGAACRLSRPSGGADGRPDRPADRPGSSLLDREE